MKKIIIQIKYFFRRNWPGWLIAALLIFQFKFNHETVTRTQDEELDRKLQAEVDSLYNSAYAKDLRRQWHDSRETLLPASTSMVNMNNLAVAKGNVRANAYDNKIAKNDSSVNAKADRYNAWYSSEVDKINLKYAALKSGRSTLPISDRAGFALMIPIIGAVSIGLMIKMNHMRQENPSPIFPVFEAFGGIAAIIAQAADLVMLQKRALHLLQDETYAMLSAFAYSGGVLVSAIIVCYNDKKKLHSEMIEELGRSEEINGHGLHDIVTVAEEEMQGVKPEAEGRMFGIFSHKNRHPLWEIDLGGYNCISDLPTDREESCRVMAAFYVQMGRCPKWLSFRKLRDYLRENGLQGCSESSLNEMVSSMKMMKAA